ncbi:ArsR/SmtB family transcription factor [Devosia limi]|uniref:Regulatory protein, arsR family n=1 Tax=Devosia limi DSM 17137 TaxID=1121477 RepID=A0A1M5EFY4_9HYPH|nr:metalloregulator ArsR/SmtB family transcription factor [Devosia limi]SHF78145.1 regulatory protein, arsR family [Devosia limi DSM 17137]
MPPISQFGALADATRCQIVEMLLAEPQPVHRITESFPISRPAISRHLRVLRDAGIVREKRKGRENVYVVQLAALDKVRTWIAGVPSAEQALAAPVVIVPEVAAPAPVAATPVIEVTVPEVAVAPEPEMAVAPVKKRAKKAAAKPVPVAPVIEEQQMAFDL